LSLLKNRPVSLEIFSQKGRHDGYELKDASGRTHSVSVTVSEFAGTNIPCTLILIQDETVRIELENQVFEAHQELKRTQSALIQSAKLASLGELSTGIAHELNQPLQAIMGFSQELRVTEPLSKQGTEYLDDVIHASKKMVEIIKSLRSFARDAGSDYSPTSVVDCITESTQLLKHTLLQNMIELEVRVPPALPLVHGNSVQIEQVLVNLMANAKDAILAAKPSSGKITLLASASDDSVTISITDNGTGMSSSVLQKIFDPFFTTKPTGSGTGLGLSLSHGLISKMGGTISVESSPGKGSTFTVNLKQTKGETL
jgi:C4-dicarboxylate-specific signal transduction histidine kinase